MCNDMRLANDSIFNSRSENDGFAGAGGDLHINGSQSVGLTKQGTFLCGHMYIGEMNILYFSFRKAVKVHCTLYILRDHILYIYILEPGCFLGNGRCIGVHTEGYLFFGLLAGSLAAIEEVEEQCFVGYVRHIYVADIYIFDDSTPSASGFEAQADIRADVQIVGYLYIAYAARHLGANYEAAMAVIDSTVVHDDILGRDTTVASRLVLAGFHANGVITNVERTARYDHIGAGLNIHAVSVLAVPGIADGKVAHHKVFAEHRMDIPSGGVLETNALEKYIAAADKVYHYRAEERMYVFPHGVIGYNGYVLVLAEGSSIEGCRIGVPYFAVGREYTALFELVFPLSVAHFVAFEGTPIVAVSIEYTLTRDGDILGIECRDGGLTAHGRYPLEPSGIDGV